MRPVYRSFAPAAVPLKRREVENSQAIQYHTAMIRDNERSADSISRHRSRDELIIAALSFLCIAFFLLSFSGINIFERMLNLASGAQSTPHQGWQWLGLVICLTVYFTFIRGNRRLEIEAAMFERDIAESSSQAHRALARLDEGIAKIEARGGPDSGLR